MKTLLFAAVVAAVGTPAMAQGWNYGTTPSSNCGSTYQNYGRAGYVGNPSSVNCGSPYQNRATYQNYGRAGDSNGYLGTGYGSSPNYGTGYDRGYSDPWANRSVTPSLSQRGVYDPVHGDFHPIANTGYGSSFPRSGFDDRFYGRGGY
ncbi:MAG: hypothetical protein SH850_02975 [Planctomycetaceae bacterium]|mgnify:CR=1 FL=1|nr:hypothetical protein [Planctomycetaceae bacterium]